VTILRLRAWRELTRRRARSFFTVITIAAAVIGLWLFAVPALIDGAMTERAERDLLWDLRFSPNMLVLSDAEINAIRDLPDVTGVEARVITAVEAHDQGRTTSVLLVGVDAFADQEVNAIHLIDGAIPHEGEVLSDPQNVRSGRFLSGLGDTFTIGGESVTISGIASSLEWTAYIDDARPVFYLQLDRLQSALDSPGINWLDVRVDDPSAAETTAAAIRNYLASVDPNVTYWEPLRIREPGWWPEQEQVDNIIQLMYVIAGLGIVSASFMVFTTMSSIVREQTREIGVIKAVGGTRAHIVRSYLLSAGVLGAIGTIVGVAAGVPLANLLVGFAGRQFSGVEAGFGMPLWVFVLSVVGGIGVTMLSAVPAIRRATRIPVKDALVDHGVTASFGRSRLDRVLSRQRVLPRVSQLGVRNAARDKGRTISTGVQVGLAIGTFLGFLAMGITVLDVSAATYDGDGGDIVVSGGGDQVGTVLEAVSGVAAASPVLYSNAAVEGDVSPLRGQSPAARVFHGDMREGRWFTDADETSAAAVAVLGPALAHRLDLGVGDEVQIETTSSLVTAEVVGITSLMVNDGDMVYVPLSTAVRLTGEQGPAAYFVATTSKDGPAIDATATEIARALTSSGVRRAQITTRYVEREAQESQDRTIVAILMILGIPVIAIGMIGLVATMTMNVIERTREIGILRSIGARARHIRRMLRMEAIVISVLGWAVAIPLGYLVGSVLIELLSRTFEVDFALHYPAWPLPFALVAAVVAAALVVVLPVRRAVRLRPGDALRYE
jgi:putative ABC transport system permease protein